MVFRMTAASTSMPVQYFTPITPWLTSMPRPSITLQPRCLRVDDQPRARRIGDDVSDEHARPERLDVEIKPGVDVGKQPDRRGIDDDVGRIGTR